MSPAERAAILAGCMVQKLGYSRAPWRIVTADGLEVTRTVMFDHPGRGPMPLEEAGYDRKRDAVAGLAALRAAAEAEAAA